MKNCLDCKYSYIEDIWGDVECKLKNHYCIQIEIDGHTYKGRKYDQHSESCISCTDFEKEKR